MINKLLKHIFFTACTPAIVWSYIPTYIFFYRSGNSTSLCFRLHRWHLCGGLPARGRLPVLPRGADDAGPDHARVALESPALQPRAGQQHQGVPGRPVVPLLGQSPRLLSAAWRWYKLPGHGVTGASSAIMGHVTDEMKREEMNVLAVVNRWILLMGNFCTLVPTA